MRNLTSASAYVKNFLDVKGLTRLAGDGILAGVTKQAERLKLKRDLLMVKLRHRTNKKDQDIAADLGITPSSLSRILHGRLRSPRTEAELAKLWGVPVEAVFPKERS